MASEVRPVRLLVLGGTGMIGSRIVNEAQQRGYRVTVASRSSEVKVDANDGASLASAFDQVDVAVIAIVPDTTGTGPPLTDTYKTITDAARSTKTRLFFVGGAGSLLVKEGVRVIDNPDLPAFVRAKAEQHVAALEQLKQLDQTVSWTYLSPAPKIAPGERTGKYRLGLDEMLGLDVSAEDYAVAALDEIETRKHDNMRFCVVKAE
eukprot:CAMPEP_0175910528 /NCGR_PEP_ID=MMETSP0108-20121206/7717_1 /TAXON_ID=195067 ORGANISM="Goniomonas pacifica, Strain CCMP1869" /NCGR_SAMPLE_ID=MMETSP0108 /ASSEMBLY_ACC=CAM_ASM_000204 /LENGTH=205 /DNA_ID=CAMNT_0017232731 /DNA_START=8 /DNA_END=625 /DNA_ORIENTATION=-